jgi:hypothetical protein
MAAQATWARRSNSGKSLVSGTLAAEGPPRRGRGCVSFGVYRQVRKVVVSNRGTAEADLGRQGSWLPSKGPHDVDEEAQRKKSLAERVTLPKSSISASAPLAPLVFNWTIVLAPTVTART